MTPTMSLMRSGKDQNMKPIDETMNNAHQRTLLVSCSSLTVVCDASISLALASSGWYGS